MRKRSKYRPKGVIVDTLRHVMTGFQRIDDSGSHALTLRIKNHASLEALIKGTGTRDDIDVMIASMNVAEALAIQGLGVELRPEITAAQNAIYNMSRRGIERQRFLFTGPEMQDMKTGMEAHDAQLDVCTVAQLEKALDFVEKEIRAKRARPIVKNTATR